MYLGDCLNPPCQIGGAIVVNGATVILAPDVEVQGIGDNRILRRVGTGDWFSLYGIPESFIAAGGALTATELSDQARARLQAEADAAAAGNGTDGESAQAASLFAGLGTNTLALAAGAGLLLALLMRTRRR